MLSNVSSLRELDGRSSRIAKEIGTNDPIRRTILLTKEMDDN